MVADYGQASDYVVLPAGASKIQIKRVSDGRVILATDKVLEDGKAYTLLATGEIDYLVTEKLYEDS